jgi:UDP-N-acetylmuramoyl-L-alanyl-D-glutamate--2,6-diaminopimelate ligase
MEKLLSKFFTQETAEKCGLIKTFSETDPLVTGLEYDSRNVKNGDLFFALPGLHTHGNKYIDDAIKKGAVVIIHEDETENKKPGIVYLQVKNSRFSMSPVSAAFYDYPSRRMLVTGVTGTEGKSSTVYMIWQLLNLLGKKAGFISTVQQCFGGEVFWNSEHQTTPEAPVVQKLLCEMADNGCEYAIVESSSHGLSKITNRLGDVEFCSAVMTNVTHDHLEFHGTTEQYRSDKANLFRALDNFKNFTDSFYGPFGVINADDKNSHYFSKATHNKTFTFSAEGRNADIVIEAIENGAFGNWYMVSIPALNERIQLRDRLPGSFNSRNILASLLAVSGLLKIPLREIAPLVKNLKPLKGRMTAILKGQPFEAVVDYAHTPSSFQTIFPPLRNRMNKTGKRIISVFGSAGERDTKKRGEQGKIAAEYCDVIILTDEDPRGEKPMDILEEIAAGVEKQKPFIRDENLFLIPDRLLAIRKALDIARIGDLAIFLGKGHENSIIYADHVIPFDEITEVEKALAEKGYR